ncbi:alpha/beta hydrolase [Siminovitchia fortis]|uniref:alpha/beta hydrolase n=1 Tax=Siminovitchia fortis TaxID=254758 RepID=UPI0011A75E10|nr:alpha/beta hydrolase [Siminovitchia fortis]
MKVNQKKVFIKEKEVHYTHIENGSTVVCFMFSGSGYSYDKPLFYYSTMTMLQNQYDVVHIHYSYGKDIFKLPLEDITKIIIEDVTPIIDEVLKNHQDQKAVFLGKSLGTIPIINGFMKNNMFMDSKMILLTPLLGFDSIFETLLMTNYSSLIVIGEEDEHYIPIKIESINNKANIIIEKIPNANHSLDVEPFNTSMSITSVDKAMKRLDAFLK